MTTTKPLYRDELYAEIALKTNVPIPEVTRVMREAERRIAAALKDGIDVKLTGFGRFAAVMRGPMKVRNPRTGEKIEIAEKRRATFRPGRALLAELAA